VAHAVAAGAVARRERPVADPPALPALLEGVGDLLDRADQEMRRLENVLDAESKRPTGGCGSARRVPRDDHPVHDGVQLELREALSGGRADPVKSLLDPRRTAVEAGGCPAPRARWPTLHIPRDADGVCHRGRELEDALSAAADEERNRRLLRSWPVLRGIHTEVPSPEQRSLPGTRLGKDLQGFGEPFQSLRHGPPAHPDS